MVIVPLRNRHRKKGLLQRFWEKVSIGGGPDSCWLWKSNKSPSGYGLFTVVIEKRKSVCWRAHRLSWILANGDIPEGLIVCHNCPGGDNPNCVNPRHLWLGTSEQNTADMIAKGRHIAGAGARKDKMRGRFVGTGNPAAKLTASQVAEIRHRRLNGEKLVPLAKEFGVSQSTISGIATGANWKQP